MALAREKIVDVALELLDDGGIDNLTTRRLAERLHVQQPALYWHFRNKQELFDAISERMMAEGHTRRAPKRGETWQEFVAENARSFRRALLAHRDGARVHAGTKPAPADIAGLEAQLDIYVKAGFTPQTALEAGIAIGRYVVGCVLEEQADADRRFDPRDFIEEFTAYPKLYETLQQHLAVPDKEGDEIAFEAGLQLIIGGLEARLNPPPKPTKRTGAARAGRGTPARRGARTR
jgi:TetR/AcrR family tetracycline transcriptional repressor